MALRSKMSSQPSGSQHTVTVTASAQGGSKAEVEVAWSSGELTNPQSISPPPAVSSTGKVSWLTELTDQDSHFQVTLSCASSGEHSVNGFVRLLGGESKSHTTQVDC